MWEAPEMPNCLAVAFKEYIEITFAPERQAEKARRLAVLALFWVHLKRRAERER